MQQLFVPSTPSSLSASIAGIGLDWVRIDRIDRAWQRHGERFASKVLGEQELQKFHVRYRANARRGLRFLATRFAAKEAFAKAIGLGMVMPMSWKCLQTLNTLEGQPVLVLAPSLLSWYAGRFGAMHVSLTDETDIAAAYVVVEHKKLERE
jgi:holo-[acyl-carrier protein] synthase